MGDRATSLSPPDFFLLDQWGRQLCEAFSEVFCSPPPYLVGSVLAGDSYRDVDVRMPISEPWVTDSKVRLRSLNLSVSLWGQTVTGLPIDFQFQSTDEWRSHDTEPRNPIGVRARSEVQ